MVALPVIYRPGPAASARVVRLVQELLPAAVDAVEAHTGETVPPLVVAIGGRTMLATAQIAAIGTRGARLRESYDRATVHHRLADALAHWSNAAQPSAD